MEFLLQRSSRRCQWVSGLHGEVTHQACGPEILARHSSCAHLSGELRKAFARTLFFFRGHGGTPSPPSPHTSQPSVSYLKASATRDSRGRLTALQGSGTCLLCSLGTWRSSPDWQKEALPTARWLFLAFRASSSSLLLQEPGFREGLRLELQTPPTHTRTHRRP